MIYYKSRLKGILLHYTIRPEAGVLTTCSAKVTLQLIIELTESRKIFAITKEVRGQQSAL